MCLLVYILPVGYASMTCACRWVDIMGNVHGRVDGINASAPALLMGSHLVNYFSLPLHSPSCVVLLYCKLLMVYFFFNGLS